MTLDEVDAELALWKRSLGAAAQNLMDLHSLPTYQRLAGSNGVEKAVLKGVTAGKVYPALAAMGTLFEHFDALQSTIDRAAELRQNMSSIFGSEQKLREIEALLRGKSVRLPAVPVPIEQRTFASASENVESISPGDLMGAMARSFTTARDAVLSVDAAWQHLATSLDNAMSELAACRSEGETLKVSLPTLADAEAALELIRSKIEDDPIGAADEFERSVTPVLKQARTALARLKALRDQISSGLLNAHRLVGQLEDLHAESVASWNDRQLKVTCPTEPVPPQGEAQIGTLREWLARLEEKFQEGMLDPIAIGLEKWNKAASAFVFHERAALQANQTPLKERNELRGRLDALKAKARARGSAEHPELTRIAAEATRLLFKRPTPLEKAFALVADYERVLRMQSGEKPADKP